MASEDVGSLMHSSLATDEGRREGEAANEAGFTQLGLVLQEELLQGYVGRYLLLLAPVIL